MDTGKKIRSGVAWLTAGNVSGRLLDFVFGIVLARLLVPADFGMIITVAVFTGFVSIFSTGGMGQSLIRAKEVGDDDFTAVFTLQLGLGIAIYLGFYLTAPLIAAFVDDPLYTELIRVSTLVFLMRPFAFIRTSWLTREMAFKERSIVDIASNVLSGVVGCLLAWFGMGVWSLTLSGLAGALAKNVLLARVTPLRLRLRFDWVTVRRHSGYGFKITINDFLSYVTSESKNLLLSKLMGPAFLGLFNKAESLSRLPNQMLMSATIQPVFRAMSQVQDDLDQTKYLFYRAITLLMVYTTPMYVGLWWVAEPLVGLVYGEKWLPVVEPLRILVLAGPVLTVLGPCGALLAAQGRLAQEMVALVVRLVITIAATLVGLEWGLQGVAWAILTTTVLAGIHYYALACRTIRTRVADLVSAVLPGFTLNVLLFAVLALVHHTVGETATTHPAVYLLAMAMAGAAAYAAALLFLPIPALASEAGRWRTKFRDLVQRRRSAGP